MREVSVKVGELKRAYKKAKDNKKENFEIKGLKFLTNYAKYLIQYFEMNKLKNDFVITYKVEEKGD